jgi:hypothetical protein
MSTRSTKGEEKEKEKSNVYLLNVWFWGQIILFNTSYELSHIIPNNIHEVGIFLCGRFIDV